MNNRAQRFARTRWSIKSSFFTALGILVVITPLVLLTVKKSIWTELEILTVIISAIMLVYLTVVLFLGVRFDMKERFAIAWPKGEAPSVLDAATYFPGDTGGLFTELGSEAGILGMIVGFLLDILASILLVFLIAVVLWIGFNGILAAILAVATPLFFFYGRVLKSIVLKGRRCRGNVGLSLLHALKSTLGYTVWFYGLFMLAHYVSQTMFK
jgi:hypothetical protein